MTALDKNPETPSFLSPFNFSFYVRKLPTVAFFVQAANVPGIVLSDPTQPTPFVDVPLPGDHLSFGELNIRFKVDEYMNNYLELHTWLRGLGFPDDWTEYETLKKKSGSLGLKSDITLLILDSQNQPRMEVVYRDAFPTGLGELAFDTTASTVNYITAEATFKYVSYEISRIKR